MRTHRVHLPALAPGERRLAGAEAHHLSRVLRVRPGDAVVVFDGAGHEAAGRVTAVDELRVTLELGAPRRAEREAPLRVSLGVALLKGDKLADVVRQGTELGAARFLPLLASRCDVRELSANKLTRWRRVAQEASKQSGRALVPEVTELLRLPDLALASEGSGLVADPRAASSLAELGLPEAGDVLLVTGPEGGLSPQEIDLLIQKGLKPVRLGPRILRAETAPVALLAALLLPGAL